MRTSGLFRRFAAHYGLDHAFANPCPGNEKGSVENKVGCRRRTLFVPVPSFHDARAFNRGLPEDRLDLSEGKRRYRLGTPEPGLFGEDRGGALAAAAGVLVRDAEGLVFYGQTGRGKTHMATASAGYPVRFRQTAQPVPRLGKAKREGRSTGCSPTWPRRGSWSWASSATCPSTWTGRGSCTRSYRTATRGGA